MDDNAKPVCVTDPEHNNWIRTARFAVEGWPSIGSRYTVGCWRCMECATFYIDEPGDEDHLQHVPGLGSFDELPASYARVEWVRG